MKKLPPNPDHINHISHGAIYTCRTINHTSQESLFNTPDWGVASSKRVAGSVVKVPGTKGPATCTEGSDRLEHLEWTEQFFFSSASWPSPLSLRRGSFVRRKGMGTSARPNSKKKNRNLIFLLIICRSSYKCGVFFKDLSSKVPLAWLGALPEAVVRH